MSVRKPFTVPYRDRGDRTLGSYLDWLNEPTEINGLQMALDDVHWFLSQLAGEQDGCFAYGAAANPGVNVGLVTASGTPNMKINIEVFAGFANALPFRVTPAWTSPDFTPPSLMSNGRIDAVYADLNDRIFKIRTGSQSMSPSAMDVDTADGEVLLAWVHLWNGMSAIYDTFTTGEGWIEDKRTRINF